MHDKSNLALDLFKTPDWFQRALIEHCQCSYPEYLLQRTNEFAKRAALVYQGKVWTYQGFAAAVNIAARNLISRNDIQAGDRVVLNLENSDAFVIAYLAILRAGCVAVPVNPKLTATELSYIVSDSGAMLYVHGDLQATAQTTLRSLFPVTMSWISISELTSEVHSTQTLPIVNPDIPAVIFYTSGTTGQPKGVVHSHRTLIAGALQASHAWGYAKDGLTNLAVTPLFHVASHSWAYPTWAYGGTLVVDSYNTERVFDLIEKHQVSGFGCVPSMLLLMLRSEHKHDRNLRSVVNVRFGASPISIERLVEIQELFPNAKLYHGMGQTESCGTISVLPGDLALEKAGSTGLPLPGCEVRIVDGEGNDLPPSSHGEILARSPSVMLEYFGNPDATQDTLRNGWLHTGDIGYRDEDGLIYLVDRKKDMIIRGGENIYSIEIENVILMHESVDSCAVIGLPDAVMGEQIGAVIVCKDRHLEADHLSKVADEIKAWCLSRLAVFKVPERIFFLPSLPQTATGKIQKRQLRQSILNCHFGKSGVRTSSE